MTPSIKGTAFASAVEDLRALVESGRLRREQLEARLSPDDLAHVDGKVLPGDWYPIDAYGRILEVLGEVCGGGVSYHVGRGRLAAKRLLESGIYRQLDRARRMQSESDPGTLVNVMLTVGRTLYNFGVWERVDVAGEPGLLRFEIRDVAALPENARHTVQGFVAWAAENLVGPKARVESRRPAMDRVQFDIHLP